MTTKTKYGQHNKRKNARAKNNKKATSAKTKKELRLIVSDPKETILDKLRNADAQGADSLIDIGDDGSLLVFYKNFTTGKWDLQTDLMHRISSLMDEED